MMCKREAQGRVPSLRRCVLAVLVYLWMDLTSAIDVKLTPQYPTVGAMVTFSVNEIPGKLHFFSLYKGLDTSPQNQILTYIPSIHPPQIKGNLYFPRVRVHPNYLLVISDLRKTDNSNYTIKVQTEKEQHVTVYLHVYDMWYLRLAGGSGKCDGRVEIFLNGTWGTVSYDNWDINVADVVCRELNCGSALIISEKYGNSDGNGKIWMSDFYCAGTETKLQQCDSIDIPNYTWSHKENAGVICSDGWYLKLLNGSNRCIGRVEILYENNWGTVCDNNWDLKDAEVVCNELNCGTALSATTSAYFGQGNGSIWLNNVTCNGTESNLTQCGHDGFKKHNCSHREDAGVVCSGTKWSVRLVNGLHPCAGRVETLVNGTWGTVCDDSWGIRDAAVVCRELNCGKAVRAPIKAFFGPGNGKIWMDEVTCVGSEVSLQHCDHAGIGNHNCIHTEDAGVVCTGLVTKPVIKVSNSRPMEKHTVYLTCNTDYARRILWLKNGSRLPFGVILSSDNRTIILSNITVSDAGEYQCEAVNPASKSTSDIYTLIVCYGPYNLSIKGSLLVKAGSVLSLKCNADSAPSPIYHWSHNGTKLNLQQNTLHIGLARHQDEGIYTCEVYNTVTQRSDVTTVYVAVKGPCESNSAQCPVVTIGIVCGTILGFVLIISSGFLLYKKISNPVKEVKTLKTNEKHLRGPNPVAEDDFPVYENLRDTRVSGDLESKNINVYNLVHRRN